MQTQSISQITRILARNQFLAKRDEVISEVSRKTKENLYGNTFSECLDKAISNLHK